MKNVDYSLSGLHFLLLSRGIILWIELPWPENSANTYAWHTETLNSSFDLIRSHQQCIPRSPPPEIEPATTEPKLYNWAHSSYRALVTPNELMMVIARPINLNVSCKLHPYSLQITRSPPGQRLPKRIRNTHPRNYYNFKGNYIDLHFLFFK